MGGPDATVFHERIHEFIDAGKKKVIVDLAKVNWMSSIEMGRLKMALTAEINNGGQFKITSTTDNITIVLTLTQLATIFEIYNTTEEALKSF